jgi:acyl-coenzyme A thioesterase PaaI-like protein
MNEVGGTLLAITHQTLVADGWSLVETGGFVEIVGQIYMKHDGDKVRYGFVAEPRFRNRRDVLHGGYLSAFADRTLALAARRINDSRLQATIELSIRFVDAVQIGEFVESVPEVVRKTRAVIFMRGTMMVGSRIVATADGIWRILAPRPS